MVATWLCFSLSTGAREALRPFYFGSNSPAAVNPRLFFVLDEVDVALDNTNVAKIANYTRKHAPDTLQFIVVSLKGSSYEKSRDIPRSNFNSSRRLTLEVSAAAARCYTTLTRVNLVYLV